MKIIKAPLVIICIAIGFSLSAITFAQDIVIAKKQVPLQTSTFMFKMPVEAQRGQEWQVVKREKKKVKITFGPNDERKKMMAQYDLKLPSYELSTEAFADGFVSVTEWPTVKTELAKALQQRFPDTPLAECERVIQGEYWLGMKKELASEAFSNRILGNTLKETAQDKIETWKISAFSLNTTAALAVKSHSVESVLASPSSPSEPFDVKTQREANSMVILTLTFKNGILVEAVKTNGLR